MANIFSSLGSAVKTKIDSAVSTINGDITQLQTDLTSEISRAQAAEAANLAAIQSNDTDISNNAMSISSNATAIASNASDISTNSTAISTEASRAQAAESTLTNDLASEISRAQAAEATNLAAIQSNDTDISSLQTQTGSIAADGNSASFSGNLSAANATISGNLTVSGTTTSVDTVNLEVKDSIMNISKGAAASANASNDGGFVVERGSSENNVAFVWDEGADRFRAVSTTATAAASDIDAADSTMTYVEMQVADLFLGTDNLGSLSDFTNALA